MNITATPVTYGRDASIPRFSVDRYQRMIETGILTVEDKVELLENYGVVVDQFDPQLVERAIREFVTSCEVPTWQGVVDLLRVRMHWESEGYRTG
jgi:hypothetical protein